MKIDGLNFLNNQLQVFDELNLKEGQKILGKIIRWANNEVLLDIAGRQLSAKVEENTQLSAGTTRMFQVLNNSQGHVVLKVLPNPVPGAELKGTDQTTSPEGNLNTTIDTQTQKAISTALVKDNLSVTPENIEKVYKFLQDFQAKYQQTISPRVFTFLMARKMPVTSGTTLASWVSQDEGIRNLLWNILRKSLPEKSQLELFSKYVFNQKENPEMIGEKLQQIINLKLGDFLEKLIDMDAQSSPAGQNTGKSPINIQKDITDNSPVNTQKDITTKLPTFSKEAPASNKQNLESLLSKTNNKTQDLELLLSKIDPKITADKNLLKPEVKHTPSLRIHEEVTKNRPEMRGPAPPQPEKLVDTDQSSLVVKGRNGENDSVERIQRPVNALSEKLDSSDQQKVGAVLDQNLELTKALTGDKTATVASCIIPFLIRDSGNQLHECLVKWEQEKNGERGGVMEEVLHLVVPTENMGEINLGVRINQEGIRINFRVVSDEVRKYLLKNSNVLKESLPHETTVIAVSLKNNESSDSNVSGVDIWM